MFKPKTWWALILLIAFSSAVQADDSELHKKAKAEGWSFKYGAPQKRFSTGLKKSPHARMGAVDESFMAAAVALPNSFHLKEKATLSPILDQGNCGSCVIHSVVANYQDSLILRGVVIPPLSRGELMNCGKGYQCDGYWFDGAAADLLALKGLVSENVYPYMPRDGVCQKLTTPPYGPISSYKIINNSAQSIMTAIYSGYPVSVTIGADDPFMAYQSGVYNACSSQQTNHEVVIEGYDCEGVCSFDTKGNLAAGVGFWHVRNSWGKAYGEVGWVRMKITSKAGKLCNNVAEEAGILETGLPMPTPKPPTPPPAPTPTPTPPPAPTPTPEPSSSMPWYGWVILVVVLGGVAVVIVKSKTV